MGEFLPGTRVKTIIWYDKTAQSLDWEVAQGKSRTKKLFAPTIELNLLLTETRQKRIDLVCKRLVDNWLKVKILLCTRKDLVQRGVRNEVSPYGERLLYQANLTAIAESPKLRRYYTDVALESILNGDWNVDTERARNWTQVTRLLTDWKEAGTELENLIDKVYLTVTKENQKDMENAIYYEEEDDEEEENLQEGEEVLDEPGDLPNQGPTGGEVYIPEGEGDAPLDTTEHDTKERSTFRGLGPALQGREE